MGIHEEELIQKIRRLPPEQISEVEGFVDRIAQQGAEERAKAIAAYAAEHGGSLADIDPDLEAAALELWAASEDRE